MSVQGLLRQGVKQLFDALDDVRDTVTYVQVTTGVYDPSTDALATTEVTHPDVKAVPARHRQDELDWTPIVGDVKKLLIPYSYLPITPKLQDYITFEGARHVVRRIRPIAGQPVHVLWVEKQG